MNKPSETDPSKTIKNIRYFKLPFINSLNINYKIWLRRFVRKVTKIKMVFSTFTLSPLFSTKDKVLYGLKSYVVYKFFCASCNASYVGETYRHISTRTHEHLETDKSSNTYQHLLRNPQCKVICDENCFSVLDSARTKYTLNAIQDGVFRGWSQMGGEGGGGGPRKAPSLKPLTHHLQWWNLAQLYLT